MLTLTVDGRAIQLSDRDSAFLADCLSAAKAHPGHRFERTHKGASAIFRISAGATVRDLPAGVTAFNQRSKADGQAEADNTPTLITSEGQRLRMPGFSKTGIARQNRYEAACAARHAAHNVAPTKTDC